MYPVALPVLNGPTGQAQAAPPGSADRADLPPAEPADQSNWPTTRRGKTPRPRSVVRPSIVQQRGVVLSNPDWRRRSDTEAQGVVARRAAERGAHDASRQMLDKIGYGQAAIHDLEAVEKRAGCGFQRLCTSARALRNDRLGPRNGGSAHRAMASGRTPATCNALPAVSIGPDFDALGRSKIVTVQELNPSKPPACGPRMARWCGRGES